MEFDRIVIDIVKVGEGNEQKFVTVIEGVNGTKENPEGEPKLLGQAISKTVSGVLDFIVEKVEAE